MVTSETWNLFLANPTLEKFGIVDKTFKKKQMRWMTKTFYEQQRFNLFVENPEGFAILVTEVLLWFQSEAPNQTDSARRRLESIIGEYSLDPLRACDVILDVFIRSEDPRFIPVLSLFSEENLFLVLKNKLNALTCKHDPSLSSSTLGFCFELIQRDLVKIEQIWKLLSPVHEQEIFGLFLQKEQLAFEYFENNFVVMIKHNERKQEEDKKRKKLVEEFFESKGGTNGVNHWGKIQLFEVFLKRDFAPGVDWVLSRWGGGAKIDWTIKHSLLDQMLSFSRRLLQIAKHEYSFLWMEILD